MPGGLLLPEGFIQAHGTGNADVERLDHARLRNDKVAVAQPPSTLR